MIDSGEFQRSAAQPPNSRERLGLVAVEPDPLNASMLEFNLLVNGLADRTVVHRCAATAAPMESIQLFHARLPGLHTTVPPADASEHGLDDARYDCLVIDVPAATLDSILAPLLVFWKVVPPRNLG